MMITFLNSEFLRRLLCQFGIGLGLLLPVTVWAGGASWHELVMEKLAPHIAIITTADLQSNIYPHNLNSDDGTISIGGMDRIAALTQKVRAEVDGALLVSTGDDLMGTFYSVFAGTPEIISMNMAGYDVVVPGNHEFDQGTQLYAEAASQAEFDIIATNLEFTDATLAETIKPYVFKYIRGLKVGFFGLVTPTLKSISNVGSEVAVDNDLVKVATEMVTFLRSRGATLVVALSHCGTILDQQVAANVSGLDLIVGGHSHESLYETVLNPQGKPCVIVQAGAGGQQVGVLRFSFTGEIHNPQWELVPLDETVGSVDEIRDYIDGYVDEFDQLLGESIGESRVALDSRKEVIRQSESNLGNLVTDAVADWFQSGDELPLAMFSSGSIRGDRLYPAGPLSLKDVLTILPFGNTIIRVKMSGRQMLAILEAGASALQLEDDGCSTTDRVTSGGFLQLSKAFKVTIDPLLPPFCAHYDGKAITEIINPGQRIVQVELLRNGTWQKLLPEMTYTVYVNSWLANGGDGHYVFNELEKFDSTVLAADALTRFIKLHTPLAPSVEGRIIILPN